MKLNNFFHKKRFFSKETVKKDAFEQKNICVTLEELLQQSPISNYKNNFKNYSSSITGLKKSSLRGRGMDFMESRPYFFQDEIRHIDWKISAKRSNLFTKVFTEEKERPIYLIVDQRSNMFFGSKVCFKSVLACKIAANIAFLAIKNNDKVGGFIITDKEEIEHVAKSSQTSLMQFLGNLATASQNALIKNSPTQDDHFASIFHRMIYKMHPGCSVIIISDFWQFDDKLQPLLFKLRKRANIIALRITDPLEISLQNIGIASMSFGEEIINFDTSDSKLLNSYKNIYQEKSNLLKKVFDNLGIIYSEFLVNENYNPKLTQVIKGI